MHHAQFPYRSRNIPVTVPPSFHYGLTTFAQWTWSVFPFALSPLRFQLLRSRLRCFYRRIFYSQGCRISKPCAVHVYSPLSHLLFIRLCDSCSRTMCVLESVRALLQQVHVCLSAHAFAFVGPGDRRGLDLLTVECVKQP